VPDQIRAAGGEIFAITSEPQTLASRAQQQWEFGFDAIGDPHHEISGHCRDRGWLELFVNEKFDFLDQSADWEPQHPKGYFQPGVLALSASGRVLYRWRGIPSRRNNGGATERPTAEHVWSKVRDALNASTTGSDPSRADRDVADARLDDHPQLDARAVPWPLFVALMVANGWFVWPRGFPHLAHGPSPNRRVLFSMLRLVLFTAAWCWAFAALPTLWVAAALAAWVGWITPRIRVIHDEFQHIEIA